MLLSNLSLLCRQQLGLGLSMLLVVLNLHLHLHLRLHLNLLLLWRRRRRWWRLWWWRFRLLLIMIMLVLGWLCCQKLALKVLTHPLLLLELLDHLVFHHVAVLHLHILLSAISHQNFKMRPCLLHLLLLRMLLATSRLLRVSVVVLVLLLVLVLCQW
jgi:hypothetical protein